MVTYPLNLNASRHLVAYKRSSQERVWMDPSDFLHAVGFSSVIFEEGDVQTNYIRNRMDEQNSDELPIDPLFLDIDDETGEVVGHEGRHRSAAAIQLGIDRVPVILYHQEDGRAVPVRHRWASKFGEGTW